MSSVTGTEPSAQKALGVGPRALVPWAGGSGWLTVSVHWFSPFLGVASIPES